MLVTARFLEDGERKLGASRGSVLGEFVFMIYIYISLFSPHFLVLSSVRILVS